MTAGGKREEALEGDVVTTLGTTTVRPSDTQLMMTCSRRQQKRETPNPFAIVRFTPATIKEEY
jgi:hypothetical protein